MSTIEENPTRLIESLKERQKELNCIHGVESVLTDFDSPIGNIFQKILDIIPQGWQFPDICFAEIEYYDKIYKNSKSPNTEYVQKSPLHKNNIRFGEIRIYYTDVPPELHQDPFLKEEYSLLNTVASILASYLAVRAYKENTPAEAHRGE